MSTLYITEFIEMAETGSGSKIHAARIPAVKHQVVSISGTHAESSVFQPETKFIRVHTDAICCIDIGSSPVATTSMMRFAANQTEYFGVSSTSGIYKISVISTT